MGPLIVDFVYTMKPDLFDGIVPKLKKPPKGTRWELRKSNEQFDRAKYMHLVDETTGESYGDFIAFWSNGEATSLWRDNSKEVIREAKRAHLLSPYSPELAGYTVRDT